jgi:hypothetical protein
VCLRQLVACLHSRRAAGAGVPMVRQELKERGITVTRVYWYWDIDRHTYVGGKGKDDALRYAPPKNDDGSDFVPPVPFKTWNAEKKAREEAEKTVLVKAGQDVLSRLANAYRSPHTPKNGTPTDGEMKRPSTTGPLNDRFAAVTALEVRIPKSRHPAQQTGSQQTGSRGAAFCF